MAQYVCSVSVTPKIIEFSAGKIVPVYQLNLDAGVAIEAGDTLSIPDYLDHYVPKGYLVAGGLTVQSDHAQIVAPRGLPLTGYPDGYSVIVGNSALRLHITTLLDQGRVRVDTVKSELHAGNTNTGYLYTAVFSFDYSSSIMARMCPALVFYDVQSDKYFGFPNTGSVIGNVTSSSRDFDINELGIIKANSLPQYIPYFFDNEEYHTVQPLLIGDAIYNQFADAFLHNNIFAYDSYTPYEGGSTSEQELGPSLGDWDLPADEINDAGTPYNDLDTWLYRVYAMTANQVREFSEQLWNVNVLDIISRYFEKPQDVVISLKSFPFNVACGADVGIAFNWISPWSSVDVTGGPVTQEIQTLDFGTVYVPRYSDCFYDYQPYSSLQVHLPYIGFIPLKMNEIVGKTIGLKYYVDVVTGDFTAQLEIVNSDNNLTKIGAYQGMISKSLPLSSQDMFSLLKKGAEISIGAIGAGTAGLAAATTGSTATKAGIEAISFAESGNMSMADVYKGISDSYEQREQQYGQLAVRRAQHAGENFMATIGQSNTPITRSGNIDGNNGRTSFQEAFFIMSVPHQNQPGNNMQKILGFPTNAAGPLASFDGKGFTTVREIRLSSTKATINELAEIERLVQGGIIL